MYLLDGASGSRIGLTPVVPSGPGAAGSQNMSVVPFGKYMFMYRRIGVAAPAAFAERGAKVSSHGRPRATAPPCSILRRDTFRIFMGSLLAKSLNFSGGFLAHTPPCRSRNVWFRITSWMRGLSAYC